MTTLQKSAQDQLRQYVERLERLDEDRKALAADAKDVLSEAKSAGFDVKTIKKILTMRRKSATERAEEEALVATYAAALGLLADLPLGVAALERQRADIHA